MASAAERLRLWTAMLLLPAALAFSPSSDAMVVTAQTWCANSVRLRIRPAAPPPAARAAAADLAMRLKLLGLSELPGALVTDHCAVGQETMLSPTAPSFTAGSLRVEWRQSDSTLAFSRGAQPLFSAMPSFAPSQVNGSYFSASLATRPADQSERIFGLGQGNWTGEGGCPTGEQRVVPLIRNGQSVNLQQRKFHVRWVWEGGREGKGRPWLHLLGYPNAGCACTPDPSLTTFPPLTLPRSPFRLHTPLPATASSSTWPVTDP
jgi:hypothetical protein